MNRDQDQIRFSSDEEFSFEYMCFRSMIFSQLERSCCLQILKQVWERGRVGGKRRTGLKMGDLEAHIGLGG